MALRIDKDARITNQLRTSVMTIDRESLITQVIAAHVREAQVAASLQQQNALAGLGQYACDNSACCSSADDDGVVCLHWSSKPVITHDARPRFPPCSGS